MDNYTQAQRYYQNAQIKTRWIIEQLFGCFKSKFPCLGQQLRTGLSTSIDIITSCAFLWNFIKKHDQAFNTEQVNQLNDLFQQDQLMNVHPYNYYNQQIIRLQRQAKEVPERNQATAGHEFRNGIIGLVFNDPNFRMAIRRN